MKMEALASGEKIPALGQGTWRMGEKSADFKREVYALRLGMDLGMTLIDTAELYDDAEQVVAEAIKGRRAEAFIVSKVLPNNASYKNTLKACERSLQRMNIECMDMYLLHCAGMTPVEETLQAFEQLVADGKIRYYGVSNFDLYPSKMAALEPGGQAIATNQLRYNLNARGIESDVLPWCRQQTMPVMAYSPLDEGRLNSSLLDDVANRHEVSAAQIALAWLLHQEGVISIPKAVDPAHVKSNHAALNIKLTRQDMQEINRLFPASTGSGHL
ncbi:MAG: diketogulonate reductase-like aldo/keto reductase [Pseudohongiellaceae bacterium]|jgi:diketogulonate reductase-like aldo/keto reductase